MPTPSTTPSSPFFERGSTNASQYQSVPDDRVVEISSPASDTADPPSLFHIACASRSVLMIFFCRILRMFLFGGCGVIFLLFLADDQLEFTTIETTVAVVCVYIGDWLLSLYLSSRADRFGRRLVLAISALLIGLLGICFYFTTNVAAVIVAGFFGVVSPSGSELGPFLSIEQSALADILAHFFTTYYSRNAKFKEMLPSALTNVVAWYQLFGSLAQAGGALTAGFVSHHLVSDRQFSDSSAYQTLFLGYAVAGFLLCFCYLLMGQDVEMDRAGQQPQTQRRNVTVNDRTVAAPPQQQEQQQQQQHQDQNDDDDDQHSETSWCCATYYSWMKHFGIVRPQTQKNVFLFSFLFFWDAFGGGLIIQSYISWYFHKRWQLQLQHLGLLFMGINIVAALSGLVAGWLVKKIGAIRTMVFTHAPSNVLLALIVVMPSKELAIALLLVRFSISQMDVPARQAYVALVVPKDEKSAANGITNSVRSLAVAIAAVALVPMLKAEQHSDKVFWNSVPFVAAGGLKLIYDFAVFVLFQRATGEVGKSEDSPSTVASPTSTVTEDASRNNERSPLTRS